MDAVTISDLSAVPTEGAAVSDDATLTPTHSRLQSLSSGIIYVHVCVLYMLCLDVH